MDAEINEHHGSCNRNHGSNSASYKHCGFLLGIFLLYASLFLPSTVSAWDHGNASALPTCPAAGPTSTGLSCDANAFTVLATVGTTACEGQSGSIPACNPASTDTRVIYIAAAGTDNSSCGTFASPCASERYAATTIMRPGSPDWALSKCGDTFTGGNVGEINRGGGSGLTGPWTFGNYDGGNHLSAAAVPADSPNCSARPLWNLTPSNNNGAVFIVGFASCCLNYWAVVGHNYYCYTRDPTNASFSATDAAGAPAGLGFGSTSTSGFLWEDNSVSFCGDNGFNGPGNYTKVSELYLRSSQFIGSYPPCCNGGAGNMGIGTSQNIKPVIYRSLLSHNSWQDRSDLQSSLTWATQNIAANHNIYTQDFAVNGVDPATIQAPFYISDNIIAHNNTGGEQFRVAASTVTYNAFIKEPGPVMNGANEIAGSTITWSHNIFAESDMSLQAVVPTANTYACGTVQVGDNLTGGTTGATGIVLANNISCNGSGGTLSQVNIYIIGNPTNRAIAFLAGETVTGAHGSFVVASEFGAYSTDGPELISRGLDGVVKSFVSAPWTLQDNYFIGNYLNNSTGDNSLDIGTTNTDPGGANSITATGNVIFGYAPTSASATAILNPQGGVTTLTITAGGTGFTDNVATFSSTCSSSASIDTTKAPQFTGSLAPSTVTFTAAATGTNQITVTSASGYIAIPTPLSGIGVPGGTQIVSQVSGTPNGNGVYQLGATATWSSTTVTAGYEVFTLATTVSGAFVLGNRIYAVTPTAVTYGQYPVMALLSGSQGANGSTYWINPSFGGTVVTVATQTFYEGCGNDDGQNYIAVQVPPGTFSSNVGIGTEGNCFYQMTSGSDLTLHGPINCEISFNGSGSQYGTQIMLFPSTWIASTSGKLYWPWYNVLMSNFGVSSAHCSVSHYPELDLTSVGGTIVGATFGGHDYSSFDGIDIPGQGCQTNDTLAAANGATCKNDPGGSGCGGGSGFPAGSGLKITLTAVSSTTVPTNNSCNFTTDNITDPAAANSTCVFTDPYKSVASYAASNASAWGISANATCTGSITSNVLTLSSCSGGPISVNDAVTWAGQTKAVQIKADKTHQPSLCGTACTGNTGNGTYFVGTTGGNQGSISMSLWNSDQYINRAALQFKGNFRADLTPCKLITYIKAGFGQSETCSY